MFISDFAMAFITLAAVPFAEIIPLPTTVISAKLSSMEMVSGKAEPGEHGDDKVYSAPRIYDMFDTMNNMDTTKNNLKAFKTYLENDTNEINQYISDVQYDYDIDINLYSTDTENQPEERYLENELKETLKEGILNLKEKEQMVLSLYYDEELTMKEIASVLDISEPRVSQIHSCAINKLEQYLRKQMA